MVLADPEKPEQPPVLVTPAPRRQSTPMEPIAEAHTPRPSNDIREPNTLPPTPESAPAPASASSRPGEHPNAPITTEEKRRQSLIA
jgi:hypothetical protein